jgi:signal transduction histidine kinase
VARRALGAAEAERRRLARELHDDTAQQLAGTLLHIRAARTSLEPEVRNRALDQARDELATAVDRVRRFALALRPPAIDLLGLTAAIQAHARDVADATGLAVVVNAESVDGLLGETGDLVLFRIVQDALSNVVKHAAAATARVELRRGERGLRAVVGDDGRGFSVDDVLSAPDGALGLLGMQERAATVHGEIQVVSAPGAGTRVEVEIPFEEAATHV